MAAMALFLCSSLSVGCIPVGFLGANLRIDLNIPLGLNGSPGIFNPFGLVQALAAAVFGTGGSTGDAGDGGSAGGDDMSGADPGAIGGVLG